MAITGILIMLFHAVMIFIFITLYVLKLHYITLSFEFTHGLIPYLI